MHKPARLIPDKILAVAVRVSTTCTRLVNTLFVDIAWSAVVACNDILQPLHPDISHPEEYPRGFFWHVD